MWRFPTQQHLLFDPGKTAILAARIGAIFTPDESCLSVTSRRRRLLIGGALLATALLAVTAVLVGVVVEQARPHHLHARAGRAHACLRTSIGESFQERGDDDDDDDDRYDDDDGVYNPGGWDAVRMTLFCTRLFNYLAEKSKHEDENRTHPRIRGWRS